MQSRYHTIVATLRSDERGNVAIPLILLPLALFAVFFTIHLGLVMHGKNVAAAAAQDGLHAAKQFGGTEADGEDAANRTLDLFQGLENRTVSVDRNDYSVVVTVTGEVSTPVGGFLNQINVTVTGPTERFYLESERR